MKVLCPCCQREAEWLVSGEDIDGTPFHNEPMCNSYASYCSEAAHGLSAPLQRVKIQLLDEITDA